MVTLLQLLSVRCCGGPVVFLTLISIAFGLLFLVLSATQLAVVFMLAGSVAMLSCLYLGSSRCSTACNKRSPPAQH
ncbi:MAG: hypothetical protein KUF72_17470 [Candidatus Thiodiazotropha sp. (ex Ctena orbiculata)]|nr:hypothetical protein [Candidatus Thiodiazotropha taylori]